MKLMLRTLPMALAGLFTLVSCATSPAAIKEYQTVRNYQALLAYLDEPIEIKDTATKALRQDVVSFFLESKDNSKAAIIQALAKGSSAARYGAATVAWEWADHDFVDPLFTALDDESTRTRVVVADAFRKQIPVLSDAEIESVAVRLAEKMKGEKQGSAVAAYASSLRVYAVRATHAALVAKADAQDYHLGTLAVALLVGSELKEAIKATE